MLSQSLKQLFSENIFLVFTFKLNSHLRDHVPDQQPYTLKINLNVTVLSNTPFTTLERDRYNTNVKYFYERQDETR